MKIAVISFNICLTIIFTFLFNVFACTHGAHYYELIHFVVAVILIQVSFFSLNTWTISAGLTKYTMLFKIPRDALKLFPQLYFTSRFFVCYLSWVTAKSAMCPTSTSSLGIRYHCNCAKLLMDYTYLLVILVVLLTCDSFFKCAWLEKR